MNALKLFFGLLIVFTAASAQPRTIDNLDAINRETRIVADVMKSALRSELGKSVRVTNVTAEYLAKQGVLVTVRLNANWLTINDGNSGFEINGQIDLEQIPNMVEKILNDLEIDLSPYEPESLETLRDLRTEQRELRSEQRNIRAELRTLRRELVRADIAEAQRRVQSQIDGLERELVAADAQYDALAEEIDVQYKDLRDYRDVIEAPKPPQTPSTNPTDIDALIARAVCDYGGTLKSLGAEDYLTVALRRDNNARYMAFKMDNVDSCSRGDMRAERLQELAYVYDS